jgi:predicted ATPase/DNA-binding CsgD family transcriptional regulator
VIGGQGVAGSNPAVPTVEWGFMPVFSVLGATPESQCHLSAVMLCRAALGCTCGGGPHYGAGVGDPAAGTVGGGVHGFPAALTSFVGREVPVREAAELLQKHRLVTVTGPGGVGKTRLAGEVARRVAGWLADGVWLVELAPVRDPAHVPGLLAAVLGIREQPGVPATEALVRGLGSQQVLLVLDNCEHVIGTAAQLCAELLAVCDDVRVLATSREPLRIAGEARYRLEPLALPGGPDDAGGSEAVALFADRAHAVDARFTLDGQSGPAVAGLVTRLDGMPLAIELAAARVEALGVAQLLDRVDDRFALLAEGDRLAPSRQRSLAATVEWSYQLLAENERRVFRLLSMFPGPFTLQAAEDVAGPGVSPAVLHLVDCSLLVPPRPGPDGRPRYVMLETLRAYGIGLLTTAEEYGSAAIALAGYAVKVAEQAAGGLQTAEGELAAARWLDAEDATMARVLAWAMDHDPGFVLRLTVALAPWWFLRGRLAGQWPLLREVAGHAEPGSADWCAVQFWLGMMARFSADMAGALSHFTAVRDAVQGQGPSRVLADALVGRSSALRELARSAEAAGDARRALAVAQEVGYPGGAALALVELSEIATVADDLGNAVRFGQQAGQITAGSPGRISQTCCSSLTSALTLAGDLAAAESVCTAGLAQSRSAGHLENTARLLNRMAAIDLLARRIEDAAAHLREALQILVRAGGWFELINSLDCCGHLCAATGRPAQAVTTWAARAALWRQEGHADLPAEVRLRQQALRQARQALGSVQTRAAEERGAVMSSAAAAEYALLLTSPADLPQSAARAVGQLSHRQRELVMLVAQGQTDAQIAAQLCISIRTVRSHLDRVRDKTGCRRRADLTRLALAAELI